MESRYVNALIGAVVTIVVSFVPFSPIVGGGVAGYLEKATPRDGAVTGAISGLMATVPVALVFLFVVPFVGFFDIGAAVVTGFVFVFVFAFVVLYTVGLSALGGFLGAYIAEDQRRKDAADTPEATDTDLDPVAD